MKRKRALIVVTAILLFGVGAMAGSFTAFIQPDERVPYFGVRGLHEVIYDGIELALEWEVGRFTFIESRPLRDLPFYVFQIRPQLQVMFGGWWVGVAVFNQYRTNHPGHIVFQPEFFIRCEW